MAERRPPVMLSVALLPLAVAAVIVSESLNITPALIVSRTVPDLVIVTGVEPTPSMSR